MLSRCFHGFLGEPAVTSCDSHGWSFCWWLVLDTNSVTHRARSMSTQRTFWKNNMNNRQRTTRSRVTCGTAVWCSSLFVVDTTHQHPFTLRRSPQSACALATDRDFVVTTISFGSREESFHMVEEQVASTVARSHGSDAGAASHSARAQQQLTEAAAAATAA